jgi:3-methyladenine DNA glycosylase AlkD
MGEKRNIASVKEVAAAIDAEIRALPVLNTRNARAVRRKYSLMLNEAAPGFIFELARELLNEYGDRWIAYELIRNHEPAFQSVGEPELRELGRDIDSWWSVDSFARTLSGPAWLKGQINDEVVHKWARSGNRWWRRAALVSTVALNVRSRGGRGDVPRTLAVCRLLVNDHDDMIAKAMSWALRELVVHSPDAVSEFLKKHERSLHARVKREVGNKLRTGLKNP